MPPAYSLDFRGKVVEACARGDRTQRQVAEDFGIGIASVVRFAVGRALRNGTKIKADASKHRAMSYARMLQTEARLKDEVEELMRPAEAADREDAVPLGEGVDEDDGVVAEVRRRETRLEWIRRTREGLEEAARKARAAHLRELAEKQDVRAEAEPRQSKQESTRRRPAKSRDQTDVPDPEGTSDDEPTDDLPLHRPSANEDGTPKPEARRNFTDPDSRIMQDKQGGFPTLA